MSRPFNPAEENVGNEEKRTCSLHVCEYHLLQQRRICFCNIFNDFPQLNSVVVHDRDLNCGVFYV